MMTPDKLHAVLQDGFSSAQITVNGEGNKFDVRIVDDCFEGKRLVARHQMVYALVNDYIASGEVHAISIDAMTHAEWQQKSRFSM